MTEAMMHAPVTPASGICRTSAGLAERTIAAIDIKTKDWPMGIADVGLLPGERILWEGRPVKHRLFWPADALLVPFSILWGGFAVFWETSVLASRPGTENGPPIFMALWGIPFVLIGLYLTVGRFFVRAVASRRTRYVLTDRRVLVVGGLSGTRIRSEYLRSLPPPIMVEQPDGSGSLAFGAFPGVADAFIRRSGWGGWGAWASEPPGPPVLWNIPDVRRARDLVARSQVEPDRPSRG